MDEGAFWAQRKRGVLDDVARLGLTSLGLVAGAILLGSSVAAMAAGARTRPSVAESFPVGTSGPACEAQGVSMGDARRTLFERKWMILCSDVSLPVGSAYALRGDAGARMAAQREEALECGAASPAAGGGEVRDCRGARSGLAWRSYARRVGDKTFVVEGLAGYDSALRLTLANLVADRIVPGEVAVADVGVGGALAMMRARAAVTDASVMVGEGYRGNSAGAYAEAAEAFAAAPALLLQDAEGIESRAAQLHEAKINRALQLSNLGAFDQADRLFAEARTADLPDPVQSRLGRNYEAIHALNRRRLDQALAVLDRPVPAVAGVPLAGDGALAIDPYLAAGLNAANGAGPAALLGQATRLSPQERASIIDAQARQLRGTVRRLEGRNAEARADLAEAYAAALRVRDGRVISITRLRAQILSESALSYEADGRHAEAEALLRRALALVELQYPDSASVNVARARLAGFLARRGQRAEAMALFGGIVDSVTQSRNQLVGMENLIRPYFDLLTGEGQAAPAMVEPLFRAGQLVARPGAADTLAQLSRKLESGDDDAATMFRRSLDIARDLERTRVTLARLDASAEAGGAAPGLEATRDRLDRLLAAQLGVLNALSGYPAYRAVATRAITLAELQGALRPGEAYFKLIQIGGGDYALFVTPTGAKGWRLPLDARRLDEYVSVLRQSISVTLNGVQTTYPFEIEASVELFDALLSPVASELGAVKHLIFEPDGAMLELPLNLITADRAGAKAYRDRVNAGGDEYDFTGIDWLGRDRPISTALSAASFRDARNAPPSRAASTYLGLGQNIPLGPVTQTPGVRGAIESETDIGCEWPVAAWNQPIPDDELRTASAIFGGARSHLVTGKAFTDEAILARDDLDRYRILHFATHGLVTAPRAGCPVRPALLTSFGDARSDGLLSFKEIFDLRLDADLVVLSACDTAGGASLEATRDAGVVSGGGQSLDGLVRAFIAAGGRQVIASHWPAPDSYDATRRLFNTFYGDTGATVGEALRDAQRKLMDDPLTSHPFYWAGFAIIGDAAKPLSGQ
ncbi:CHAT domain-containing protein [Novosphingobium album (ex Liu et al. 2023)]|nr:CHAT domain-containing tetratricopeptide repeat protein [Novosphingobium album (ex Liu et al. 2023)]